ncbi:5-bromo-4-chloroindolyl phosphate hydrolysis family protein [Colidextribacter sp. OB.20]|uniref:5-bromo-4-chloroindolyl phosphate hydrolysis family protein n=1 Tax=Colidextribacter sp. OB.20 TaxID=2304568 RepID=UPI001FABBC21|nr:5-bromo-4-chloroindolyl phosphate hydrolysis family protein [Colidextribacter sp. OB.20]
MTTHKKVSVLPIYLVGLVWLGYALLFPLNAPLHYVLCSGLSLAAFVAGKAIFPDKVYQTPEAPKTEAKKPEAKRDEDPKVAALRKEKDRAVSELRRLNDAIPDEKISAQIDHLEEVTGKIIDHVIANPAKQPQISRFLDYFLPTTIKLLNAYDRMDSAGISGSNIDATKGKVETMLDTLCAAFDKQLDSLFGDEALDISTDITVMENLLAQEGLSGGSAPTGGADGPTLEL